MSQLQSLTPVVRITISNPEAEEKSAFGPGIAKLCLGVREHGSLNAAAKAMRMAYSKAWRVIKDTESTLGVQLLLRDGAHGSTLTAEGETLLDAYLAIQERLSDEAAQLFAEMTR
ncbi:winged helix-turn-helix domain-containing protein [uncultured Adlercreutzia sp.]|uniref:winged helix-turn-helix domain-containing protein n=1 Tax=uncultured Adlercreutzia sp. TaxID=875803 RepID=UPI00267714BA|nr:LysR family transcriptional regulator [uncultured Adlercreutzia sp.]